MEKMKKRSIEEPNTTNTNENKPQKSNQEEHSSKRQKTEIINNPYLAHLNKSPFNGWFAGKTTAEQARIAEEGEVNPFTNKPFGKRYYEILKNRRTLPVHAQRNEFLELVHNNQFVVFVGETGSGKTTQLR
ncbi:12462_t:CDS:1 [Acaulospora colombiana]|uniref:12462_t:CDS:1 n=1 Tax=Acaulospora colombiana TaxID=27376 RepID=A0ACA9KK46_9GLOM|nr:12462_t:CDS:1 [Acaulospora colombiana]